MKKETFGKLIFALIIASIFIGTYLYKVLCKIEVTKWDKNGNEIYSWRGKGTNKSYWYYDDNNLLLEYKSVMKSYSTEIDHVYYEYENGKKVAIRSVYDNSPEKNHETKIITVNEHCVQHVDSLYGITTYEYDANSNLIKLTKPDGTFTAFFYDVNGNKIREENSDGSVRTNEYDSQGRLTKSISENHVTIFEYVKTSSGYVKKRKLSTDGGETFGLVFTIDENDALVEIETPSYGTKTIYKKVTRYTYWPNGNKKSKRTYTLYKQG